MIHIICINIVISPTYFNKNDKWKEYLSQFTHITEYLYLYENYPGYQWICLCFSYFNIYIVCHIYNVMYFIILVNYYKIL